MTRINLVPPSELCDQHLLAEFRELTRIPNNINNDKVDLTIPIPKEYCLGTGHVRFFYNKLEFLRARYIALFEECLKRGFNVKYIWPYYLYLTHPELFNNYIPTPEATKLNRDRLAARMPAKPRYSGYK